MNKDPEVIVVTREKRVHLDPVAEMENLVPLEILAPLALQVPLVPLALVQETSRPRWLEGMTRRLVVPRWESCKGPWAPWDPVDPQALPVPPALKDFKAILVNLASLVSLVPWVPEVLLALLENLVTTVKLGSPESLGKEASLALRVLVDSQEPRVSPVSRVTEVTQASTVLRGKLVLRV